jgi:hypothetical protein
MPRQLPVPLPTTAEVPSLATVATVVQRVRGPRGASLFLIGICEEAGQVTAAESLASFRQVQEFSRALGALGYAPLLVGSEREMAGCDIVFVRPRAVDRAHGSQQRPHLRRSRSKGGSTVAR